MDSDNEVVLSEELQGAKRGRLIVFVLLGAIVLGGGGFFYYNGIQTAKTNFAGRCISLIPKLSESFNDYRNSSNKPNLFDEVASSPSSYLSSLKSSLGGLRAAAQENSRYSGAKKTIEALDAYSAELAIYEKIKQKELSTESRNPHLSKLRAWSVIAKANIYRTLVDDSYNRALQRVGQQYEDLWDNFMDKNFTSADTRNLLAAAKEVDTEFVNLANLCRGAKG